MRTIAVIAGLAAWLAAGACDVGPSRVADADGVTISGRVLQVDGAPLAGRRIVVARELDPGQVLGGLLVGAVSLGLACLVDNPPALCAQNAHPVTTGADGTFSVTLTGAQTHGSLGTAATMEVLAGDSRPGTPLAYAEFHVQTATVALPDLRLWSAPAQLQRTDPRSPLKLSWPPLAQAYGTGAAYSAVLRDARGQTLWAESPAASPYVFDPRVLEDVKAEARPVARAHGSAAGTPVDFTYEGESTPVEAGPSADSRRASCSAGDPATTPQPVSPCWLTDGDLLASGPPGAPARPGSYATIDLGSAGGVAAVVLRGCVGGCRVETSPDDTAWSVAGTAASEYSVVTVHEPAARWVRVTATTFGLNNVREVSVFRR